MISKHFNVGDLVGWVVPVQDGGSTLEDIGFVLNNEVENNSITIYWFGENGILQSLECSKYLILLNKR